MIKAFCFKILPIFTHNFQSVFLTITPDLYHDHLPLQLSDTYTLLFRWYKFLQSASEKIAFNEKTNNDETKNQHFLKWTLDANFFLLLKLFESNVFLVWTNLNKCLNAFFRLIVLVRSGISGSDSSGHQIMPPLDHNRTRKST